jgi:hypothetical protein
METIVGPNGVETTLRPAPGDMAFLESILRLSGEHSFEGEGVLTFGDESNQTLNFKTVHAGHLDRSAMPGVMAGSANWQVQGGTGRFQSATGLIASAFTLNESGELSEYHCGLIFVTD